MFEPFETRNLDFAHLARAFALKGVVRDPHTHVPAMVEKAGASSRVVSRVKAVVGMSGSFDDDWAGVLAADGVAAKFVVSLASQSIFVRALALGMAELPLGSIVEVVTGGLTGSVVGEGKPRPVSHLSLSAGGIQRRRATALVVLTNTLLAAIGSGAIKFFDGELRKGVARGIDTELFSAIIDGATPLIESAGSDDVSARADIEALLGTINTAGSGGLLFAMAPDVANRATLFVDDGRGEMTPSGGRFFGVDVVVSDAVTAGTMIGIDATGLAGSVEKTDLRTSGAAALQLLDEPVDGPTTHISLWQSNSTALAVDVDFGVQRVRDTAVAVLSDIAWGAASAPAS